MAIHVSTPTRRSITTKLFVIIILAGVLLIPSLMIMSLVEERRETRDAAVQEISATWGSPQQLIGPILTIPYRSYTLDTAGRRVSYVVERAHFLPEELAVTGVLNPEVRYRGIYQAVLYRADVAMNGRFAKPDFESMGVRPEDVLWNDAFVSLGIPDMRGVRDRIALSWDGGTRAFEPGVRPHSLVRSGVNVALDSAGLDSATAGHRFSIELDLNGSGRLAFAPIGRVTTVDLKSAWSNPSFDGAFLPSQREVGAAGFGARWKVLDLNRNFPQVNREDELDLSNWEFGVSLLVPVDSYHQTMRSVKYAALFIGLTFIAFFLIEVMGRMRVHAIQYLLVGSALVIFYLLLLSLSEYVAFAIAYAIAAGSTVLLVVLYVASVLRRAIFAAIIAAVLVLLYGYLFVLLQLQDYSLLLGSIGVFAILATVMYLTRRLDWYALDFAAVVPATDAPVGLAEELQSLREDDAAPRDQTGSSDDRSGPWSE
jgi:inner membrane protein